MTFLIESAISSCHGNYNLDPLVDKKEGFTEWYSQFPKELLEMSPSYRKYKTVNRTPKRKLQRATGNSDSKKKRKLTRHRNVLQYGHPTKNGLACHGRHNLAKYLRKPRGVLTCKFCGKKRKVSRCSACNEVFCMEAPVHLTKPGVEPPRKFRENGPVCWQLVHGFESWQMM